MPAVLIAVLLSGCLEPPIIERLDIRMLTGGGSIVSVIVSVSKPSDFEDRPKVQQRLESATRALEEGTDPWSHRLAAAAPTRERDVRDLADGRLFRLTRHGQLAGPDDLGAFLRDTGVGVAYEKGDGWEELTLLPGRPGRPTLAQRERVKSELGSWSVKLAAYFSALASLYAYLDRHPERARVCLASILTKAPPGESLSAEESELSKAVEDAMGDCGSILVAPPDDPFTIDELSRMVYDPFPAAIRIAVPGEVLEREGFPTEGALEIPEASLWSAFVRLEGRFVSPDPALLAWRRDTGRGIEIDLDTLTAQRRHASRPTADDARVAIEDQLRTAPVYRVRWAPVTGGEEALPFDDGPSAGTGASVHSGPGHGAPA